MRRDAIDKLRARTVAAGCDGLLVLTPVNIRYLTGYHSNAYSRPLTLILPVEGEPILLVPRLETAQAMAMTSVVDVRDYVEWEDGSRTGGGLEGEWLGLLEETLRERGLAGRSLAGEEAPLSAARARRLQASLGAWIDSSGWVETLRVFKTPLEVEHHRQAVSLASLGMDAGLEAVRQGRSEREIWAAAAERMLVEAARQYPQLPVSVGGNAIVGPRTASLHTPATGARPASGDLVFVVLVAAIDGSACEFSRTIVFGEQPSPEQTRMFDAVEQAHAAALAAVKPGVPALAVDAAARASLGDLARYQTMRTGHGLGFSGGSEAPHLGAGDRTPLAPGMVISIEPAVCIQGAGGVCWADNFVVTDTGASRLSDYPVTRI
jgi:Xaa-Pro dipeptidase